MKTELDVRRITDGNATIFNIDGIVKAFSVLDSEILLAAQHLADLRKKRAFAVKQLEALLEKSREPQNEDEAEPNTL